MTTEHTLFCTILTLLGAFFGLLLLQRLDLPAQVVADVSVQEAELGLVQGDVEYSVDDLFNDTHDIDLIVLQFSPKLLK